MIRRTIRSAELDEYDPDNFESDAVVNETTDSLKEATIITSEVDDPEHVQRYNRFNSFGNPFSRKTSPYTKYHAPVLDLDFPATLIPSSTPGHFHLYLDTLVSEEKYFALLDALAEAGIIEDGYAAASKARGYTAVRLPWVAK